ncbi:MAG: hypothetical protein ACLP2F_09655 [Steroidobacteraceae bacterium]
MKPRTGLAPRLAFGLSGLAGLAWFCAAHAQTAQPPPAVPWSAANLPGAPAYQDRYISGDSLAPDISAGQETGGEGEGLARFLQIDAVTSRLTSSGDGSSSSFMENGIVAKSLWETAGYGAWSLDASARLGGDSQTEPGQGGVVTLRQRGMPFDGDWLAENALGDLNSPDIGLARIQPRFYLPTGPMQGLTTEWHGPSDLQIVAGGGVPGIYDGILVPDFRTLDGSTATAGAQWSPASHWTVGGQFVEAHDVNLAVGTAIENSPLFSSDTGLLTAAWADGGEHVQMNLLDGDVDGKGNGVGGWVDGSITQGRIVQNAGIFRIDPNVTWGNQLIASDVQGGYYRFSYQSRQWLSDAGIDEVRSVSDLGTNTTFLTGDTRYQILRDWGIGGVGNLSLSDGGNSWSLQGYVDHVNRWGTGRVQGDYATTPSGHDTTLTLDQTWSMPAGIRLSTSTFVERISSTNVDSVQPAGEQDGTVLGIAAYGGGQFTARLSAEGNVRWATSVQGRVAPGVSANVSLTYQLSPAWKILLTYYDSQIGSWTPLTVESPLTPPVATPIPAVEERGVFLTFRYQRASGSHFAPLGGAPGAGSGQIAGIVYLDANNNGRLDAGEAGAANVTVVLDGRFSAQTDATGRFDFPVVATGHHVITVISDNLPLPWTLVNEGRTEVEVSTRGRTDISIGAQRLR